MFVLLGGKWKMAEQNEKTTNNEIVRRVEWKNLPLYMKIPIGWFWINTALYLGILIFVIIIYVFNINI